MPRLISHHTSHRQSRTPRRGLNRPARARPVADAAALYCVQQKVLSLADCDDRLWWHPYSHGTLLLTMSFVSACQIRTGASVTCAPVRKASDGMLLSGVPIPGCRSPLPLGPTFAFQIGLGLANRRRRSRGPLAADLSNCTRRDFSRRWPGRSGRVRVRAGHVRRRVRFPSEL